jgi:N-acetylglucosaminyldiphosphoundecaprenol N-acetyl-beta-D-mannosaminyltransferase
MKYISILNVPFINTTQRAFVDQLEQDNANKQKRFVITANPEIVMQAQKDGMILDFLHQADYVTPDGIGIVIGSRLLNQPLKERITGYDSMIEILKRGNSKKYRLYLLGASPDTLPKTVKEIQINYPGIEIVGSHHGYFDKDDKTIINEINRTSADFIFVALGVPKQEHWIAENISHAKKGIFIGVGGSFDVIAGTVKRAPNIWVKLNLEWFYRLIKQPSRWKRMLSLPYFALSVLKVKYSEIGKKS